MSSILSQSDKSAQLITVEECDKNIARIMRNIKILFDIDAPETQVIEQDAELKVWKSLKYHIEHGEKLFMDDQGRLQRFETDKKVDKN
jgi:hypothetical protein